MSLFFDFFSGFGKKEESKTEQLQEERSQIKKDMSNNLKKIGFTAIETAEVLTIIDSAEKKIALIKASLIGSNINNENVMDTQNKAIDDIRQIQQQMGTAVRSKIQEIKLKKQK